MNSLLVRTVTGQLVDHLRERILAGGYAPGAALRQDVLADEFGTSKIPVREALVRLQSEGLVDIFPNRGFQVRPLVAGELREIFDLRLRMEPTAAASGCRLATEADQLLVPRLQPIACEILDRLHTLAQRYVQIHLQPQGRVRRAKREHAALLEAWMARKPARIRTLLGGHIQSTWDDLKSAVDSART